jgi:integrase
MSPFRRGKYWSLYIPRRSGGVVQRATGTMDPTLAKRMGRMVDVLQDTRRWDVLEAMDAKRVTVGAVYDAYVMNALDALMATLAAEAVPDALDFVDRWVATLRKAPRTVAAYEQKVRTLLGAGVKVSALTAGWLADRLAQLAFTPATVRQYAHAFSLFARYLRGHGLIATNPVTDVELPKGTNKRAVWKTEAEDRRLVDCAPEPCRTFFALVHSTGAERDAALSMVRANVDLTAGTVHIPGTKNRNRDRKGVPIEPWALPILAAHCRGLLPDAPLFPTLTRRDVGAAHMAARTAAKLPGYQLRDGRHSYAVRAILRGEPIWKVSKWLGHANIGITATVYTQFDLEAAQAELNQHAMPSRTTRRATS